jgi:predicted metalloprotease with PDZ domain
MSEARPDRVEARLDGFEERLRRIEGTVIRIDERLATVLPDLATKAELADLRAEMVAQLADKPSRLYMWGVVAAMTGAYTAALAAVGVLLTYLPHH